MILSDLGNYGKNLFAVGNFLFRPIPRISFFEKLAIIFRFSIISRRVECSHYLFEILAISRAFLEIPPSVAGVFVEAGAYKGGSTVKLSLIAKLAGRKLIIFDSFRGLPQNDDVYTNREGVFFRNNRPYSQTKTFYLFKKGLYRGTLDEVKRNIALYGAPEVCAYRKGWFEETMPKFHEPIAGIFLDVDISSSTKTCLTYLYPLLQRGGILYSHDGHLDLVLAVFTDRTFWKKKVGVRRPPIDGIKTSRLLRIQKN